MHRGILLVAAAGAAACASDPLTETPVPVARVDVSAPTGDLWVSDTVTLTAIPRGAGGRALSGRTVLWSSSDTLSAVVTATGVVTAVGAGPVTIRATVETVSGEAGLSVADLDLIFEGFAGAVPEAFVLRSGGGEPTRVFDPGTIVQDPTPSRDGRWLLYTVTDYGSGMSDVWAADLRTGLNRQITADSALDDQPAWSPDAAKLAFRSDRAGYLGEIWVVNADGTGLTNLTPTVGGAAIDYRAPAWSPDGSRIAYASTAGGDWGIWIMDPDGGNRLQLTNTPDLDAEPTWSPDGTRLAFRRSSAASGSDILILDLATRDTTRIALPGEQRMPAWSPDGRRIAFVGHPGVRDQPEIHTMRPDGSDVVLRTTNPARGGGLNPDWRKRTDRQ